MWARNEQESTIGLIFALDELSTTLIKSGVHGTEHGSDYRTIETTCEDLYADSREWSVPHLPRVPGVPVR